MSRVIGILVLLLSSSFAYGVCYDDISSYKEGNCDLFGFETFVFACKNVNELGQPTRKQVLCGVPGYSDEDGYMLQDLCGPAYGAIFDHNPVFARCTDDGEVPPVSGNTFVNKTAKACGSVVSVDQQVLSEFVELTGIDFPLVYSSEKVKGRKSWNTLNIPVSTLDPNPNSTFPAILGDSITVNVAGRTIPVNLQASANQTYEFIWDGLDLNNLPVTTTVNATVNTVQHIDGICDFPTLQAGEHILIDSTYSACNYRLPRDNSSSVILGSPFNGNFGIGGWDFSIHHYYDELRKTLFLGNGNSFQTSYNLKSDGEKWILSEDRSEVYVFLNDHHIRTKDSVTGGTIYEFSYNSSGKLIGINDKYGNNISIQYSGNQPVSITSAKGLVTSLEVNSNGYLSKITSPNSESHLMSYSSTGLLLSFENPNGVASAMTYDNKGNLLTDISDAGSSLTLTTSLGRNGHQVTQQSALSRQTHHSVNYTDLGYWRASTQPSGYFQNYYFEPSDSTSFTSINTSDNTTTNRLSGNDSRFLGSKIEYSVNISDYGRVKSLNHSEQASLTDSQDPFSYTNLIKSWEVNYKTYKSTYNKSSKTEIFETPSGRKVTTVMNSLNDPTTIQASNFAPISFTYNNDGSISSVAQDNRMTTYTYNSAGWMDSITNPLGEITKFTYDNSGKILTQRFPDLRFIQYRYDKNGNLISITPPYKPTHEMTYNGFDLLVSYIPPYIQAAQTNSNYVYSNDKELLEIHRPNGDDVIFNYNQTTQNLDSIDLPNGSRNFTYYNGVMNQAISEDFVTHNYSYAGSKLNHDNIYYETTSFGVHTDYNDDFLLSSEGISTSSGLSTEYFTYDYDNLLTTAGSLNIARDVDSGLVSQLSLGNIQQDYSYNSTFGELSQVSASTNSQLLYSQTFTRDKLGRIKTSAEKYGTQAEKVYTYNYDNSGRLVSVLLDGQPHSAYGYDYNSNRNSQTANGISLSAAILPEDITVGSEHSCALTNAGVKCWGEASNGRLGYKNNRDIGDNELVSTVGNVIVGGPDVKALSSAGGHNCVQYISNQIRCWGENTYGQLGLGNTNNIGDDEFPNTQSFVDVGSKVVSVHAGDSHTCAIRPENKISCWGRGDSGQLGYGNTNTIGDNESPATAGDVLTGVTSKIIQLALGDSHTCLLAANGKVKCWGSNSNHQIGGTSANIGDDELPSSVGYLNIAEPVAQIAAGGDHTCALMDSGKVKCWGRNDFGQLGLGNTSSLSTAIKNHPYVDVGEDVKYVSAGRNSTCVVTVNGNVKCWGLNDFGQLGQGNATTIGDDELPSTVQNINLGSIAAKIVKVADKHVCAVLEDSNVMCWGNGLSGRLAYGNVNSIGDNETPSIVGVIPGLVTDGIKYDDQDRLIKFGTKSFAYNANGELINESDSSTSVTKNFEYDAFGNLKKVILPNKTISYKVDAHNRRIVKLEGTNVVEFYIWNDRNQLVATADSSGAMTRRFVYGSKVHSPDYMSMNGVNYQIISNHLGSPVQVVNSSTGTIEQEIVYDEFGNILSDSQPGYTPFGFAGCLYEQDTKLCRFGVRDYDASIGRWLSKDPILFSGGDTNLYGYVMQEPINWIDPLGLAQCKYSISTGKLTCVSNDGSKTVTAQMFSGEKSMRNQANFMNKAGGPIPVGTYKISKLAGRDWFLDPGSLTRAAYRAGLSRGGFKLHLRGGQSLGCITGESDSDNNLTAIHDMLSGEDGSNSMNVGL